MLRTNEGDEKRFQEIYEVWKENKQRNKDNNAHSKSLIKDLAEKLEIKPSEISKAFAFVKSKEDHAEDGLDAIVAIYELLKG